MDQFVKMLDNSGVGPWREWVPILAVLLAWLGLIFLLLFLLRHIDFRIGPKHLKVTLLGIPIRRVRLDNIRNLHTRRVRFAERWHNMLLTQPDRVLVIEKKRGLIKHFIITPEQRYVFKSELDRAIRAHLGLKPGPTAADTTTFDRMQVAPKLEADLPAGVGEEPVPPKAL